MSEEFDQYVDDYDAQHRKSIRISGESPDFFANYKISELKKMAQKWGFEFPQILDFGSGIGNSIPAFRAHFQGATVAQSDLSGDSLKRAKEIHGGNEPQIRILEDGIAAEDNSFDIVFTACVFHHIPHSEHDFWLREILRVTRPNGHLVVFEHNPWNPLTRHAVRNCPFDANAHLISSPEMSKRLRAAGWVDTKTTYHVFFPATLASLRVFDSVLGWMPLGAQYSCAGRAPAN
jgi:SAM-dependent methyltransferase